MIVKNTLDCLALELMTSCQAIDIRRRLNSHGQGITPLHQAIYNKVREKVAFFEIDREIWPDIQAVKEMIYSGELLELIKEYIPDFQSFSPYTCFPLGGKGFALAPVFFSHSFFIPCPRRGRGIQCFLLMVRT